MWRAERWHIVFEDGERRVFITPTQYGVVKSVACSGPWRAPPSLNDIIRIVREARAQLPAPGGARGRYGRKGSAERGALCQRIAQLLNERLPLP